MEDLFETLYITTTLPYANSEPHIGHAIEFLQADAHARYFRSKLGKEKVFFNTGLDEHGLKILTTARDAGLAPEELLQKLLPGWMDFCSAFDVTFDRFYRTSSADHHDGARRIWQICNSRGDIYKKHYTGLYCIGCESFLQPRELTGGKCPHHHAEPVAYAEENYFFRLSKYAGRIMEYVSSNPDFLKPESKRTELLNFLKTMEDISISRNRSNLPWGIAVPGDPGHTMYVWFDALANYILSAGFESEPERFAGFWPGIQLCGPDNLRFQGAIWQGILASLGLPFTRKLLVHGTILGPDAQKMSKSLGNVISPLQQFKKFGADYCRFYLLGILHPYQDCSYREADLIAVCNTHLANGFGNLVYRLVHLGIKKEINILDSSKIEADFKTFVDQCKTKAEKSYEAFELHDAVRIINELVAYGNKYIHTQEPWKQNLLDAEITLNNLSYLLRAASKLFMPIIPNGATRALQSIQDKEKVILYPRITENV